MYSYSYTKLYITIEADHGSEYTIIIYNNYNIGNIARSSIISLVHMLDVTNIISHPRSSLQMRPISRLTS